jgi:hypothetical protein
MDVETLVSWMASHPINNWITSVGLVWPIAEIIHFIGLSLLLGSLLIVDLRLLGFFRSISIATTHKLLPWAIVGFSMNLMTGVLFLFGDPHRYSSNIGFRIKAVLIVIAGLNALWFYWKIKPAMGDWGAHDDTPVLAKTIAVLSLGIWFGVLFLGRLIPYVGTG